MERQMPSRSPLSPLASLKGTFPFRLGTTSCVLPDEILPNVRFLAPSIDDIELVLFESETFSNIPPGPLVRELRDIARDAGLSYTVHLPLDIALGHVDPGIRAASLATCLRLVDSVAPLAPLAYIVHFTGDRRGPSPSDDMRRWLDGHRQALTHLAARVGRRRLCVETLEYPFDLILPVIEELDLGVCCDVGHLVLNGHDVFGLCHRLADRIAVFHVHGIVEGRDHRSLAACDPEVLALVVQVAGRRWTAASKNRPGPPTPIVLTMEVFAVEDVRDSLEVMRTLVPLVADIGETEASDPLGGQA